MTSIITGDIINSRRVINQELWLKPLKNALNLITENDAKFEIFRGDSFQLEIKNITESFKTAIYLKATIKAIKGYDVRLAIGIGSKNFEGKTISESNGSVFQNSGNLLEFMKQYKINLRIKTEEIEFDKKFNIYFKLATILMDRWTINSAEAVKVLMETKYGNQYEIAKKIGISQDAVSKRLKRANIDELLELNGLYEQEVIKL